MQASREEPARLVLDSLRSCMSAAAISSRVAAQRSDGGPEATLPFIGMFVARENGLRFHVSSSFFQGGYRSPNSAKFIGELIDS